MTRPLLGAAVAAALVLAGGQGTAEAGDAGRVDTGRVDTGRADTGRADVALPSPPAAAAPAGMVRAIVVLRAQADLSRVRHPTRRRRLAAVEQALRAQALATQPGMLALLRNRRAQGLVSDVSPLWIVNEVAVTAAPSVIAELAARSEVREVRPDLTVEAPPPASVPGTAVPPTAVPEGNIARINAPGMWDLGYRGQGVVVAAMDTGVDVGHPDLAGRWRGGTNSWYDPSGEHPTTPTDVSGHGTQTMGVLVGGGAGGTSIGVAPGATWIAVKIFNDRGQASTANIHRGFQWLLDPDGNPATADAPNVVNDSWTMSAGGCNLEFQPDLASLRAAGILPVFSAGNYGPAAGTVLSPANNPAAFAVGGVDDSDLLDPYSSRGPSACAGAVSPRLAAPGVDIRTSDLFGSYVDDTGTSVAAPHVAGALALLLSAFPDLPADRQEGALQGGAVDLGPAGPDADHGFGRLDALAAYRWLAATPDFGVAVSPSSATTPPGGVASYSVSITGLNGFTGSVSLALSGLSAAQAGWSFAPTVVAGGSGAAQLTVTTAGTIAPGSYPLTITASSGPTAHTASAVLVVPAPPDFGLSVTPATRTAYPGSGAGYLVGVSSLNGFTGVVSPTVSGLPAAVGTATFSPATVAGAGSSQLAITTAATAPAGTYRLTVTGTSGATTHAVPITLVVLARDFSVAVGPSSVSVSRGSTASYTASTSSTSGFTGGVTLSVTGLPTGTSATFTPNPVAVPGTSALRVRTTQSTPRGTFTLRFSGRSGTLVHQAAVTLVVR